MTLLPSERSSMVRSSFQTILQLRLQNRRSREQLAQQGIMPPLKGLPYVIEQRSCLDRGKNEDSLKHKTQSRLHQPDLVQANALEDAVTDPTETEQKRARLADDLSEKILCRPGPLELLEKSIVPLHPSAEQGVKAGATGTAHETPSADSPTSCTAVTGRPDSCTRCPLTAGNWQSPEPEARTECGSGGQVSPQQPGHHQSQGGDTPPRQPASQSMQSPPGTVPRFELVAAVPEGGATGGGSVQPGQDTDQTPPTLQVTPIVMVPPRGAEPPRPPRQRKVKEVKRKVRKLKYHQYVPPDQRAERGPVPLDAAYSRLLQQQQLYLQLQILSRQHLGPGIHPEPLVGFAGPVPTQLPCVPLSPLPRSLTTGATACSPKPELLPANLDDLTVSELRQQLRKRGLPVSGTKPALLERLKPYQISGPKLAPPSPGPRPGPPPPAPAPAPDEQALLEKQKVIERLAWKLRQEQRQARGPDPSPGSVALPLPSSSSSSSSPHFPHPGFPESRPSTPTSPGNPFLFPSANIPTSANTTEVKPLSPRRQPRAGSPLQDSSMCDTLESQAVPTEFCLSPASLHSFFPMEDVDFDARHDSRSEETFDSGVLLSSSLGSNTRELGSLEALDNPGTGGFQSLEEELTEAIRSAELSQTPSIEEILDEPLVSTGPRAGTDPDSPGSPPAAVGPPSRTLAEDSALPPALDLLPNPSHCRPFEPLSPPSPAPSLGVRCPSTGSPEIALDPADWLEALPGAGSLAQTSAFSVDFLEVPDLNVSRMIDLLVDQW